jgi:NAD+ kinase
LYLSLQLFKFFQMKIAIFGKRLNVENIIFFQTLLDKLKEYNADVFIFEKFYLRIKDKINITSSIETFTTNSDLAGKVDFLFSFGGDGTLLDTITLVRDSGIPIMGINMGRLGFLASIKKDLIAQAIDDLFAGRYTLDKRTLLRIETNNNCFGDVNFALNELTIHKKDPFSMVTIDVYVNGVFLNSYWGDGLIVATPTGSTAYSLSTGGPILSPDTNNFIINPIATHNLTVRPIVIPDSSEIKIKIKEKDKKFFISLDSRSETIDSQTEIVIKKESFYIFLVKMKEESFFQTIREKLLWGLDIRN